MKRLMKHKLLIGLGVILVSVLLVISCAKPEPAPAPTAKPTPAPAPQVKPIKMRLASGLEAKHGTSIVVQWFADEVGKRTKGALVIETYHGGVLLGHREVIDAVKANSVEFALSPGGHWNVLTPLMEFPNIFFLTDSEKTFLGARDVIREVMTQVAAENNIKFLYCIPYGEVGLANKKRPVNVMEDMKGLKIRGVSKGAFDSLETLGAVPYDIPTPEVYDAIAKGAVDGVATGTETITARKWYEATKYVVLPFNISTWLVFMNMQVFNGLPKEIQNIVLEVAKDAEARQVDARRAYDDENRKLLSEKQTIKILTSDESKVWAAKLKPVHDAWVKSSAAKGHATLAQKLFDAHAKAR